MGEGVGAQGYRECGAAWVGLPSSLQLLYTLTSSSPTTTPSSVGTPDAFRQYVSSWVKHAPLTQMTEEEMKDFSEEERRQYEISGGRRAKPEEIADVVYLLALPESGWVTGQTIEASVSLDDFCEGRDANWNRAVCFDWFGSGVDSFGVFHMELLRGCGSPGLGLGDSDRNVYTTGTRHDVLTKTQDDCMY